MTPSDIPERSKPPFTAPPPATALPVTSRLLAEGALFVATYVGLDVAERALLAHGVTGLPWYLPAGLALAFVVVRGIQAAPWIIVARLLLSANDWHYLDVRHGLVSAVVAAALTFALTFALAVPFRRLPRTPSSDVATWRIGDVATFFALALLAGGAYGAAAALLSFAEGVRHTGGYLAFALEYGIGDAIGIVVVMPLVLMVWPTRSPTLVGRGALWARVAVFGALTGGALGAIELTTGVRVDYLGLLPLGWAAVRAGVPGAAIGAAALDAAITIAWTIAPGTAGHTVTDLVEMQSFMLIAAAGALMLGAATSALDRELTHRRGAEQRLRDVVDQSVAGFFTVVGGRFVYANAYFASILGYTIDELYALRAVRPLVVPEDLVRIVGEVAGPLGAGQPAQCVTRVIRRDGALVVLETHFTVAELDGARAIIGAVIDRTTLTSTEATLRERDEQLRQAQKLEAIGLLAGGVAHDFNNMLTAIGVNVSLALQETASSGDPWPAVRDALHEIRGAAQRAGDLTRKLLAFGRKQVLHPQAVALDEVADAALPLLRRVVGEDVRVDVRLAAGAGTVMVDPTQIEQVLLNLVVNARDAMRGSTEKRLVVATFPVDVADGERLHARAGLEPGRYAVIAVSDSGAGMDEATRARIFEPFFTTKPLGEGTGLGLATVFGIVKQSGGSIYVDSTPGGGARFSVYPPRSDAWVPPALHEPPLAESVAAAPTMSGPSLLIVEDEDVVRHVVGRTLAGAGYHVLESSDPADALRRWPVIGDDVRLVVADMVMPEMNGLQLAAALRSGRPDLPVLLMSGYSETLATADGPLPAGTVWIGKPFTSQELRAAVAAML